MRAHHELLQHAAAPMFPPAAVAARHLAQRLDVQVMRLAHVHIVEDDILALDREFAVVEAMRPFRMAVAEAEHEEVLQRRERRRELSGAFTEGDDGSGRMPRAALPCHLRICAVEFARRPIVGRPHRAAIPRQSRCVVVAVEEQARVVKAGRRPQPEELRRGRRRQRLRIAHPHRAHAPGAVARSDEAVDPLAHAVELDKALVVAVLRQPRVIHQGARADAADKTRLLDRGLSASKHKIGLDTVSIINQHA